MHVSYSYNVTIRNLEFDQCSGDLISNFQSSIIVSLFLHKCLHCKVEDVSCFGYGFAGINLFLGCYINNLTINLTIIKPTPYMCTSKFLLVFKDTEHDQNHDSVSIHNILVIGYSEICHENYNAMTILLYQHHYDMKIELYNSHFYNMNQAPLDIHIFVSSSFLI